MADDRGVQGWRRADLLSDIASQCLSDECCPFVPDVPLMTRPSNGFLGEGVGGGQARGGCQEVEGKAVSLQWRLLVELSAFGCFFYFLFIANVFAYLFL